MSASQDNQPVLRVVGALHIDEVATVQGQFVAAASNPVAWQRYVGGVGGNAARAAQALFDLKKEDRSVSFHAALGDDSAGQSLVNRMQASGLRVHPQFIKGYATGRYSVVVDESGQMVLGLADVQLAEKLTPTSLLHTINLPMSATVLLDANLSPGCLQTLIETASLSSTPVAALTVSPAKATRLLPWSDKIDLLFCNRREAHAMAIKSGMLPENATATQLSLPQLADTLVELGFNDFVLTDAASTLIIRRHNLISQVNVPPVKIDHNVNGAGDALAGASVAALLLGLPLERAVTECGLKMAADVLTGRRLPLGLV
ncbi:MAG: PfkB family carbohydrate kinase [Granulosicoccus sp.]